MQHENSTQQFTHVTTKHQLGGSLHQERHAHYETGKMNEKELAFHAATGESSIS
jgi:hypothetical protein